MAKRSIRIASLSLVLTALSALSLAFFVKSIGILFEDWFAANAGVIAFISGSLMVFFIVVGMISFQSLLTRSRGLMPG